MPEELEDLIIIEGDESEEEIISAAAQEAKQEENLLEALQQKGPALPVELAVRTYSFPDEIARPLSNLEQRGFVQRQSLKTGEMIVLTQKGQKRLRGD